MRKSAAEFSRCVRAISALALVAGILVAGAPCFAQEVDPAKPAAEKSTGDSLDANILKLCRDDMTEFRFGFADKPDAKCELKEVMKWSNPVRERQIGVVFVVVHDGRAEALTTVFSHPNGEDRLTIYDEFQSLSPQRLVATKNGAAVWSTAKPGVILTPIPDAPPPADTPLARIRQMRNLAREFAGHSISYRPKETKWELRMLTQPLYRYEAKGGDVLDGAVFTFVSEAGTDPELIVLIEARKVGEHHVWHFAPARFSDHTLVLKHRDREVWTFVNEDRSPFFGGGPTGTYRFIQDRSISESSLRTAKSP